MPGSTGEWRGHTRLRLLLPPVCGRTVVRRTAKSKQEQQKAVPLWTKLFAQLTDQPVDLFLGLLFFATAGLLARASLLQGLAPFHLALTAAVLYALPGQWRAAALGAVVGRLLWHGFQPALVDLIIIGGIYAAARAYQGKAAQSQRSNSASPGRKGKPARPSAAGASPGFGRQAEADPPGPMWILAAAAAAATFLGTGLYVLVFDPTAAGVMLLVFRTALVALLAAVFCQSLQPLRRLLQSTGVFTPAWLSALVQGEVDLDAAQEEWLSGAVLAGACIAALQGLQLGPIAPAATAAAGLILFFALRGGPGPGAAAGAAAGLLVSIQRPELGLPAATYAIGGLLAGLFREFGLIGIAGGYAVGILVLAGFSLDPQLMITELWSLLPVVVMYGLFGMWARRQGGQHLPPPKTEGKAAALAGATAGWSAPVLSVVPAPKESTSYPRPAAKAAPPTQEQSKKEPVEGPQVGAAFTGSPLGEGVERANQLEQLGHLLRDMAATLSVAPAQGGQARYDHHLWRNLPGQQLAGTPTSEFDDVLEQHSSHAHRFDNGGSRPFEQWLHRLAHHVCAGCHHHHTCWDQEFFQTYKGLADLVVRREITGDISPHHLPARLRSRCPRKERLISGVHHAYEVLQTQRQGHLQLQLLRQLMAQQLESLADVTRSLARGAQEAKAAPSAAAMLDANGLPYRVGVARVAQDQGLVSGDSYLTRLVPGRRLALILSDGMGAGMMAARESRAAIDLLEKLLGLDLDPTLAIRLINQLLLARSPEDSYTTLDLALVDLDVPQARFVKVGAPPSFLRQADRVGMVRAGTPPIGILADVLPAVAQRRLRRGDLIVMVTDGILGAWSDIRAGEEWLQGFLRGVTRDQPRWVATQIVRQALRQAGGKARDDMTALAVKLL